MGEVRVNVRLTNSADESAARRGYIDAAEIRTIEADALVDAGAVSLVVPSAVAERLGLARVDTQIAQYADGRTDEVDVTEPIHVQIMHRRAFREALVLGDEVIIGQTTLEKMDLLVDPRQRKVLPNPAHPDQPVIKIKRCRRPRRVVGVLSGLAVLAMMAAPSTSQAAGRIAHFRLDGPILESPENIFSIIGMSDAGPPQTMKRWLDLIEKAGRDASIVAVYLTIDNPTLTLTQAQALRRALDGLPARKPVYVHADRYGMGAYLVAAAGAHVGMTPTGQVDVKGVAMRQLFFKNLLDRIGVRADMMQVGAYKGAVEPFLRAKPSAETIEQTNLMLDSLIEQIADAIAARKGIDDEQARGIIDEGVFSHRRALTAGLVDVLAYRNDFTLDVRQRHGMAEVAVNYGQRVMPAIDMGNPFELIKMFGKAFSRTSAVRKATVALIHVDGLIVTGQSMQSVLGTSIAGSETLRRALATAAAAPAIRAVVLRINSPGGDALASDVIYESVRKLAEKKPVVVSMGDYAASGGYYIAAGARHIFAEPGTITGSIGVAGGKITFGGLGGLIGITSHQYKRGDNADFDDPFQPFTDPQRALMKRVMEDVYADFRAAVKTGRGKRIKDLDAVSGGRVFTGNQAIKNGLVDEIGGLDDALRHAAREARLADYNIEILPHPKTFIEVLMDGLGMTPPAQEQVALPIPAGFMPVARRLPGPARRSVGFTLNVLDLMRRPRVLAITPQFGTMQW